MKKIEQVEPNVWVGPGVDVKAICEQLMQGTDWNGLGSDDIVILDVADDFPEYPHHRDTLFIHAGLNDGPEDWSKPYGEDNNIVAYINAIDAYLNYRNRKTVMVHCHGGVSRAGFIYAVCFGIINNVDYSTAKELSKKKHTRQHIHPKHDDFGDMLIEKWL